MKENSMNSPMISEALLYELILYQGENNKIGIKIRECDIYSFVRDHRKNIKILTIDFEKREAHLTFLEKK